MKVKKRKVDEVENESVVEIIFKDDWFETSPRCPHGPMLLFERFLKSKKIETFYACSAGRDKQKCKGYKHNKLNKQGKTIQLKQSSRSADLVNCNVAEKVLLLPASKRKFCFECQKFVLKTDDLVHHDHKMKMNISDVEMMKPSTFLPPQQDSKAYAQYFISEEATSFIYNSLKRLDVTRVVCLGMPRLHERIQTCMNSSEDNSMRSILLDIDERHEMFWSSEKFIRFNMFNRFFFAPDGEMSWKKFIGLDGRVSVVVDPPFGGSVEAIAATLRWMENQINSAFKGDGWGIPVILWLFPYFMERRISDSLPSMKMLDYQVSYDNHKRFKNTHCHSNATPVRIFTNIDNEEVVLPEDHYRFCSICQRYVSKSNQHCRTCRTCSSKNGKTYVHCDWCRKCVKPGWKHCSKCGVCDHPKHVCGIKLVKSCYLCGKEGHERRNCPRKLSDVIT